MLFGIDTAALSAAYMLASLSACPAAGPVQVNVNFVRQETPYVTNWTSQQLTQTYGRDPDSTSSTDGKWMVSGLNKTSITGPFLMQFRAMTDRQTKNICFSLSKVDFNITYANTIFIASDYKNMGCRSSATMQHEKRHVTTDVRVITDFIPGIKKSIQDYAQKIGPQGPFAPASIPAVQQHVGDLINAATTPVINQMIERRRQQQALIDNVPNYMRDTALCPGQFPKFDGSQ